MKKVVFEGAGVAIVGSGVAGVSFLLPQAHKDRVRTSTSAIKLYFFIVILLIFSFYSWGLPMQ